MSQGLEAATGGKADTLVYRDRERLHHVLSDQHDTLLFEFMTLFRAHQARTVCPIKIHTV